MAAPTNNTLSAFTVPHKLSSILIPYVPSLPSDLSSHSGEGPKKYPGVTSPLSLVGPKEQDLELSKKLEESMWAYGVFETEEEQAHRSATGLHFSNRLTCA